MGQSRRRQFLIASGVLLAPSVAHAQPARRFRAGVFWASNKRITDALHAVLVKALRERGYVPERNLTRDARFADGAT